MDNKIYGLIGISQKASKVVSGEFSCEKAIKSNKVHLVIIAKDASDNTSKKFNDKCKYRKIPIVEYGTKESLGNAIGKVKRASIAITDEKLAKSIADLIKQNKK